MSLINVVNLTFAYEGSYDTIFENVSFQMDTDWKLGFTGRNGRGKTTFLKLLMGCYEYQGSISSSESFSYFPYEVQGRDADTMDVVLSILPDLEEWKLFRELNLLEISAEVLYRPFSTLSNGEQTKVLLAVLFLRENSFLLIDEPTNHLDQEARETVSRYLNGKKGFILVSHDRDFLDRCVDHILSINKTNIEVQKGNFSSWLHNKELQDNFELAENEKLKKDIRRLEASARQASNWSDEVEKTKKGTRIAGLRPDRGFIGHKAAKMMKRSKNIEDRKLEAVEDKSKLLKNIEISEDLKLFPLSYHADTLLELENIRISYDGSNWMGPVSFKVRNGSRIALSGKNGCGKSSILKLILGNEIQYEGTLRMGSGLKISYISQDTSFLKGSIEEYAKEKNIEETLLKAILRKLDFSRDQFNKDIHDYSGGQKKKVLLAGSLCEQAHLYLWDEPLNFIDVLSRIQIENLIRAYSPTILFVEHDHMFTENLGAEIVGLSDVN